MLMSKCSLLSTVRHVVALAGLLVIAFPNPAYAYVDPGSLSIVITAILGAIAAISYTARLYWDRFKSFLARVKAKLTANKNQNSHQ
jgi:hypothetical protein